MGEKAALKEKLDAKQKELVPYTAAVNEVQGAYDIQQQELDLLTAHARNVTQQLTEARDNLRTAGNMESDRTTQIAALEAREQTVASELAAAQKELKRIVQQEGPLAETVREKRCVGVCALSYARTGVWGFGKLTHSTLRHGEPKYMVGKSIIHVVSSVRLTLPWLFVTHVVPKWRMQSPAHRASGHKARFSRR